jgi:16S rRNA (adenine1518-N6/adenine1519-N6)-dimethyltransferase
VLERAGIDPQSRGEQLQVADFLKIARVASAAVDA